MANGMYAKGFEGFLDGTIDWDGDDIRAILVDTVDLENDETLDDLPSAARVAVSGSLTGKTAAKGVADADDATVSAVSGDTVEAIVVYQHTGVESTSRLIAYYDTGSGLPFTPQVACQTTPLYGPEQR